VHGELRVVGQRLDRAAPKLRADVPSGYGIVGFEPVALLFPSMGCWKVTGSIGDKRFVYVVRYPGAPGSSTASSAPMPFMLQSEQASSRIVRRLPW
jgi:hypothetical protein